MKIAILYDLLLFVLFFSVPVKAGLYTGENYSDRSVPIRDNHHNTVSLKKSWMI